MNLTKLKQKFEEMYGSGGEIVTAFAPGRVNLIGEHTDYNGGFVFPCALQYGTYGVFKKSNNNKIRLSSIDFPLQTEIDATNIVYKKENDWSNYLHGVAAQFILNGYEISGYDGLISGNIPNGAGLSSSASVEILMSVALNEMFKLNVSTMDMVKFSQDAENKFVGLNCGIMDQFASGMGQEGYAMLLNCKTMAYNYVPVNLADHTIVIANTNKRRELSGSKYNERRKECDAGVLSLKTVLPKIEFLSDVSYEQFLEYKHIIKDDVVRKRAQHIICENKRVCDAVKLLQNGNLEGFGELLNQSHESLKNLYEVTGDELDALVDCARLEKNTLGSRMTGAGFGGCTVTILEGKETESFIKNVGNCYTKKTALTADFYIAEVGSGGRIISSSL